MEFKRVMLKIITSNIDGKLYDEKIRKAIMVNFFSLIGASVIFYFFIEGIVSQRYLYSSIVLAFLLMDIFVFVIHQIKKNTEFASFFIVISFFFLELLLLVYLGTAYTGLFWFYVFPAFSIFIIGRLFGTIISVILIFLGVVYINFPIPGYTIYESDISLRFVITFLVVLAMTFIVDIVRDKIHKALKMSNQYKKEYLKKILQQSKELKIQKNELNLKNIELEKLSIIASETKNSILITDKNLKIEWVNDAFIDSYGYTLEEYQEKCSDIIECSGNKKILTKCIEEKISVDYINSCTNKYGKTLWVQTNVTPILNNNNEINKIIFIESDITQLKKIEQEIEESNTKLYKQKEEIITQKDLLQEKNNLISSYNNAVRDSISYSLKIQKSILPPKKIINEKFNNFIFYKPKDIVSGDFYWFYECEKYCFFAVVDCTGHGVPGAFMSILGIRILNEIVEKNRCTEPSKILEELHEEFFSSLNQRYNLSFEGMDLLVVRLEKSKSENKKVYFAGAKRPFIYYDSKKKKVYSFKTTRKSVGGIISEYNKEEFFTQEVVIPPNSMIYLCSDGFVDQHNDERNRIGTSNLLKIIDKVASEPVKEQYDYFYEYFEEFKQSQYQTDDVLVWGIRIR